MVEYKKTRSTKEPKKIIMDKYHVYINKNIVSVNEEEFVGYEYDMKVYDKDEYIELLNSENQDIKKVLIEVQVALIESYEKVGE